MSATRRDFLRTVGASGAALAASDLVASLVAQSPKGRVLESRFKGLADIALTEARRLGCSYGDVRFTRNLNDSVAVRDRIVGGGGGFGGGGGGGGGFGGGGGRNESAGFGVRVLHSGVWGFSSSPIVTEDQIRTIAREAVDIARASAMAKRFDVSLTPTPAHQTYWATPITTDPFTIALDDKIALLLGINEQLLKTKGVFRTQSMIAQDYEWKYFASSEGSYIEQESWRVAPSFTCMARAGSKVKSRTFTVPARTGGYEVVTGGRMMENADRIAAEAVEHAMAPSVAAGLKDIVMTPSHSMLTIHEIIGHPTELDRILGYEANYAGTSFIKLEDVGKLKYGSPMFNVTADRTIGGGLCTVGYDDDGVKTQAWPIVREGVLVGLQTNRETARFVGETESRGCTFASSWRNYPFLRMPNVHVEPGPDSAPSADEIIADTRDGILIDGRGSYSIDQQRYNGQFGGDAFWEIKNGKKVRMVADVTYNAITTDFYGNLDAISNKGSWEMHGTTGDAKGQPVQINHISHGAPWMRVRKVMIGAAYL
ncbi:MAG: TldD/PmbA family protein [Acidobacteria bacterium]|nr:TldD/PmbA family protein [Acidobacteriota bacterium]